MGQNSAFLIPFAGLKNEIHHFEFKLTNKFFEGFSYFDFIKSNIKVDLIFEKKVNMLELNFKATGYVNVPCDLSMEPFNLSIDSDFHLVVKFGNSNFEKNDELLILPHGAYKIDVAHYIYEMVVLAIPHKKVHPSVIDGTLKSEILQKLKELEPDKKQVSELTDPRWDKLRDLL
tara:strand:- start:172 stop:693 length:522 start_codon:yes stop_codon:yes gene_type:complete